MPLGVFYFLHNSIYFMILKICEVFQVFSTLFTGQGNGSSLEAIAWGNKRRKARRKQTHSMITVIFFFSWDNFAVEDLAEKEYPLLSKPPVTALPSVISTGGFELPLSSDCPSGSLPSVTIFYLMYYQVLSPISVLIISILQANQCTIF